MDVTASQEVDHSSGATLDPVPIRGRLNPKDYVRDTHFSLLAHEAGSGVPLMRSAPRCVSFDTYKSLQEVTRADVPGVAGAFVLSNVLSRHECEQMVNLSSAMGYSSEAKGHLRGRSIRTNEQCVWIADDSLWSPIWKRLAHLLPEVNGRAAVGINQRWRCYRYGPGQDFSKHHDGAWLGSGIDASGRFVRDFWHGERLSQMTLLLYLADTDDYEGGATTFFDPDGLDVIGSARVAQGGALCFFHGEHPLSPLHEGTRVLRGVKFVVRTDILYPTSQPDAGGSQEDETLTDLF